MSITKSLRSFLLATLLSCVPASYAHAQNFTFDTPSGALTAAVSASLTSAGYAAIVYLDVTTLTLPDADDEVDFYIQTTYDGGASWTDVQNVHFTDADDGTTAEMILIVDGTKDGPGTIQPTRGTNPAVGAEISETVPANTIWRLLSLEAALTTDGTGTPRVKVIIGDGSYSHYTGISETTQPVSVTETYVIGPVGMSRASVDGVHFIPLPPGLLFAAGHEIKTLGIDSGDDWAAPSWIVGAWHDPSISTDGSIGDNLKSYDRPLGSQIRIVTAVTGTTAPTYRFTARGIFR